MFSILTLHAGSGWSDGTLSRLELLRYRLARRYEQGGLLDVLL